MVSKKTGLPCYNISFGMKQLSKNFITVAQKFKDDLCLQIVNTYSLLYVP